MRAPLETRVFDWFDRNGPETGPFALAYSGGGDSHALLCLAADWCARKDRTFDAFIVDHGLRPQSVGEAEIARQACEEIGVRARILRWQGEKPATGVQAAARQARHRLLADACRQAGIRHLLLAHTRDDQNETVWMRLQAGGDWRACAGMAASAPSPVWPDGRDLRLHRPLLDTSRAELRTWLTARGAVWIEDPSNTNAEFTRIAIRQRLSGLAEHGGLVDALSARATDLALLNAAEARAAARLAAQCVRLVSWGGAQISRAVYASARPVVRQRLLRELTLSLSGRAHPPRRESVAKLDTALADGLPATGGGVMLVPADAGMWMMRDRGAVLGRVDHPGLDAMALRAGEPEVWDGRFEIETSERDIMLDALGPDYAGLEDRSGLDPVPAQARPGLLAARRDGRVVAVAGLGAAPDVQIRPLFGERFASRLFPDAPPAWFHGAMAVNEPIHCVPDSNLPV